MILGLGTAQLGLHYGVNNSVGGLTDDQALGLLDAACRAGFGAVDVSHHYGHAEQIVDSYVVKNPGSFVVLRRGTQGYESVYTWQEAEASKAELIQLPANCLDGRNDEVIPLLQSAGKRVMVRSLLLQGLLAVRMRQRIPSGNTGSSLAFFDAARPYLDGLKMIASKADIGVVELAVRWAWYLLPDIALFGAETEEQVIEIAAYWVKGPLLAEVIQGVLELRQGIPEVVISPRMWRQDYGFTS